MPLKNIKKETHHFSEKELLDHFHSIQGTKRTQYTQKRPYISSSMCPRAIMLNGTLEKYESAVTPTLSYYAAIGNAVEAEVLKSYEENNSLLIDSWKLPNVLFPPGVDLGGKLDAIIWYKGTPVLVDIKTVGMVDKHTYADINTGQLRELQQTGQIILTEGDLKESASKKVKEVYQAQLQLYCAITGLDNGYILSISRRIQDGFTKNVSASFKAIDISDAVLEKRIAVLLYGIEAKNKRIEPTKLQGIKKTHCNDSFCNFVDYCWSDGALPSTIPFKLNELNATQDMDLKKSCFARAKEYISTRNERVELTMQLIEDEKIRRTHINDTIAPLKSEFEKTINDYGLYPWQAKMNIDW